MIARHITSHDENGMRLLGIGREIHRTPTQQALENLAMDLASREGSVIYAQQRCMDGAAISKAYHCEGRVIVDSVYFSTIEELKRLYTRAPLGDGLFFAAASTLGRPTALPSPASEALKSDASFDEFADAVNSLFPDEDALADVICALRTPILPLAVMGDMPDGEFSRKLYMALELILRSMSVIILSAVDIVRRSPATGCSLSNIRILCRSIVNSSSLATWSFSNMLRANSRSPVRSAFIASFITFTTNLLILSISASSSLISRSNLLRMGLPPFILSRNDRP